jgi:hypothetical protein
MVWLSAYQKPMLLVICVRSRLLEAVCLSTSQAFSKDAACDKVFYKSLAPLLGKVMPVEVARQCTVMVGEQKVFDQRFNF